MELRLYDTFSREKRTFKPLDPNNVRMYVCGPTVYDFAHIGNARPVIVFDVLFRLLQHLAKQGVWDGGRGQTEVTYVRNITDVDDKINDRAARDFPGVPLNEAIRKVTEVTDKQFHEDVDALGALRPTAEPRATEHIPEMRAIIEKLVAGGFAYVEQEHVLFSPEAMNAANSVLPRYGSLANRSLDEMIAGARVDVAPYKRGVTDFVLWKPSKPGEPSWPSPAGIKAPGRPGWHIECSAMSDKLLWEDVRPRLSSEGLKYPHQFDIHGGGVDLVFPHHENELAQTCCAFRSNRMANVWMHNGFLQVEGEKMSKSLGNFVTIREMLTRWNSYSWPGEALRFNMLRTHYRQPIDWTLEGLDEAHKILWSWYEGLTSVQPHSDVSADVIGALSDDLNTPQMISVLHGLHRSGKRSELRAALSFLGFSGDREQLRRTAFLEASTLAKATGSARIELQATESGDQARMHGRVPPSNDDIAKLVSARTAARARKDFKESDRIRDELAAMGVVLKDGKDADGKPTTTWEVAR